MPKPIRELNILSAAEKETILSAFNDTACDYPRDKTVHQLFEEQVERTPDKVALIACDKTLTYRELNEEANRIAHGLIEKGVSVGDVVAFMLPRKSCLIAAMLGILKAGAAYMPIDPDYPQDRIDYMLADSKAKICVTEDIIYTFSEHCNSENLDVLTQPSNKYCIIYTSGSTGQPKGCILLHKGITNFSLNNNVIRYFRDNEIEPIGVSVNNVTFDYFIAENIVLLLNGYTTVLCSKEKSIDPVAFWSLCDDYHVNLIQTTPTRYRLLLGVQHIPDTVKIELAVTSGEPLTNDVFGAIRKKLHAEVFNPLGPSECSVWCPGGEDVRCTAENSVPMSALALLSPEEYKQILYDFNDTAAEYPKEKTVHQLFEEQVERTPDKVALIACDRALTYRELNEEANRIAHGLIESGVGVGDIAAFMLPRKSCLIAAMLGILKAGATYMPIDPDYPQDRIDYMLADSKATICVTEDNLQELLQNENLHNPKIAMSSDDLCYCIYTSGSTGNPKGVLLSHVGVNNYCNSAGEFHSNVTKSTCILGIGSATFDVFLVETAQMLLGGKKIVLASENQMASPDDIADLIELYGVDILCLTPSRMRSYLQNPSFRKSLIAMKSILLVGEVLQKQIIYEISKYSAATVFNGYGPSETTIGCIFGSVLPKEEVIIGRPIANTQIHIVDKHLNPVPIGVTGELCIAGDGVGLGYLNRPELTAEKFIDNPFGEGKLYKTGDLAYWREDGNIVYVGRNDFQVKIRGLRIELGEIENAMQQVEGISQAVVIVRKDEDGRQLICAFYTGWEVDAKTIRAVIGQKLPRYMLPHIFTHLEALPMTTSGKVNRNALPEVDLSNISSDVEYVKPIGELEKQLAALMEQVLGYAPIGLNDDFFDLGCDSLKAIEFVSKAHSEGIYIPLQNVFDYPTVQTLAGCIQNGNTAQQVSFEDVDFTEINKLLAKNTLEQAVVPPRQEVGNLLLAGATGYLGIHLLADYLEHDGGTAYCLVRGADQAESEQRLSRLLDFYFDGKYADLIGSRIQVLCGDLQKDKLGLTERDYADLQGRIDTVINAAASVKHYGSYRYFYEVNVETTRRLIDFCQESGAKLIHISTLSVSGNGAETFENDASAEECFFSEKELYLGQSLENVYARSKFEAELAVLEAMTQGLRANIMRMGNLQNRSSDGVFQINHESNAAAQRIKGMLELGCAPDYLMHHDIELTPVDEAARAVMTVVRHFSTEQTVFHINNTKLIPLPEMIEHFTALGYPVKIVNGEAFIAALRQSAKDSGTEHIFETFINDLDANDQINYDSNIHIENSFTEEYLRQLGFEWGEVGVEYLRKYVRYFRGIRYFDTGRGVKDGE